MSQLVYSEQASQLTWDEPVGCDVNVDARVKTGNEPKERPLLQTEPFHQHNNEGHRSINIMEYIIECSLE